MKILNSLTESSEDRHQITHLKEIIIENARMYYTGAKSADDANKRKAELQEIGIIIKPKAFFLNIDDLTEYSFKLKGDLNRLGSNDLFVINNKIEKLSAKSEVKEKLQDLFNHIAIHAAVLFDEQHTKFFDKVRKDIANELGKKITEDNSWKLKIRNEIYPHIKIDPLPIIKEKDLLSLGTKEETKFANIPENLKERLYNAALMIRGINTLENSQEKRIELYETGARLALKESLPELKDKFHEYSRILTPNETKEFFSGLSEQIKEVHMMTLGLNKTNNIIQPKL